MTRFENAPYSQRNRPAWAFFSGFAATVVMTLALFTGYGVAHLLGAIGAPGFAALTANPLVSLASDALYAAIAVHITAGVVWAFAYAYLAEPRLPSSGWQKGIAFSVVPWLLSLAVFLPLLGVGPAGVDIGAGPLPALASLGLHLVYGVCLGAAYDLPLRVDTIWRPVDRRLNLDIQKTTAMGALAGGIAGFFVSLALQFSFGHAAGQGSFGLSAWFFALMAVLTGGALGAAIGSMAGLPTGTESPSRLAGGNGRVPFGRPRMR